jgi:hypothetical protein
LTTTLPHCRRNLPFFKCSVCAICFHPVEGIWDSSPARNVTLFPEDFVDFAACFRSGRQSMCETPAYFRSALPAGQQGISTQAETILRGKFDNSSNDNSPSITLKNEFYHCRLS